MVFVIIIIINNNDKVAKTEDYPGRRTHRLLWKALNSTQALPRIWYFGGGGTFRILVFLCWTAVKFD